jgi:hypothetical protein
MAGQGEICSVLCYLLMYIEPHVFDSLQLTSHQCSKNVLDINASDVRIASDKGSESTNPSLRGESTLDVNKASSAEILKQMRRDSGATDESSRSKQIRYSKGNTTCTPQT